MDARIITTKKFLKEALLSLLTEKPLSKINVKSLCERAEINRATFYSHYKDVSSLFNEMMNEFMGKVSSYINKINSDVTLEERKKGFINLIKYIDKNSDLFLLFFENTNNIDSCMDEYKFLQQKIYQKMSDSYDKSAYSTYITEYFYYGGGSLLHTWIVNGKKESIEELAKIMFVLLTKGYSYFS